MQIKQNQITSKEPCLHASSPNGPNNTTIPRGRCARPLTCLGYSCEPKGLRHGLTQVAGVGGETCPLVAAGQSFLKVMRLCCVAETSLVANSEEDEVDGEKGRRRKGGAREEEGGEWRVRQHLFTRTWLALILSYGINSFACWPPLDMRVNSFATSKPRISTHRLRL